MLTEKQFFRRYSTSNLSLPKSSTFFYDYLFYRI
jgi:hypothetical protein